MNDFVIVESGEAEKWKAKVRTRAQTSHTRHKLMDGCLYVDYQKSRRSTASSMAQRMDPVMCGRGASVLNKFARRTRLMQT